MTQQTTEVESSTPASLSGVSIDPSTTEGGAMMQSWRLMERAIHMAEKSGFPKDSKIIAALITAQSDAIVVRNRAYDMQYLMGELSRFAEKVDMHLSDVIAISDDITQPLGMIAEFLTTEFGMEARAGGSPGYEGPQYERVHGPGDDPPLDDPRTEEQKEMDYLAELYRTNHVGQGRDSLMDDDRNWGPGEYPHEGHS